MSFLSKIFGSKESSKKPSEKEVTLHLKEVPAFIEKEISSQKTDFEKTLQSKFAEIKHLRNQLNSQLKELSSLKPAEGANPRLLKVFNTSKQQMLSKLQSLNQKLEIPNTTDLQELQKYSLNASASLTQGIFSSGKSIAYTGFLVKEQMKFLGKTVNELNQIFSELNELFKKNDFLLIDFNAQVNELNSSLAEIASSKKRIASLKEEIDSSTKNLSSISSELTTLQQSPQAKSLSSIEEEIISCNSDLMDLKNKALAVFSQVERPFKKLQNFAEKNPGVLTKKQSAMLETYLDDAFLALKTDLQAKKLLFLLKTLKNLINSNEIEFSEKEKTKTLESISELEKLNFIEEFFWKENSLKKKLHELETKKAETKINDEISSKQSENRLAESELQKLKESLKTETNSLKKLEETFFYKKQALQKALENASGKNILIETENK